MPMQCIELFIAQRIISLKGLHGFRCKTIFRRQSSAYLLSQLHNLGCIRQRLNKFIFALIGTRFPLIRLLVGLLFCVYKSYGFGSWLEAHVGTAGARW